MMAKKQFLWWYQDPDEYKEWKFLNSLSPEDLKKFSTRVEDKRKKYGNLYFYKPIPKLIDFHNDTNDFRNIYGNNGSGKSMGAGADCGYEFLGWSPWRDVPSPDFGSRLIWIATTDYKIQQDSSQLILFADVLSPAQDIGLLPSPEQLEEYGFEIIWEKKKEGILGAVVNPWDGTRLVFKSMESKTQSFSGAPLDYGWVDEIIPADKYDELSARTLRKHGRLTMSFLIEDAEDHYTFNTLYKQYQDDIKLHGSSGTSFYFLEIEDNTYLDQKDIEARKKKFTDEGRRWRFTTGGFFPIEPKGQIVYEDFVPEHHTKVGLVKEFDNYSTLFRVWDLGYHRPCCTGFQIDKYNRKRIMFTILGEDIQLRNFIDQVESKTKELFPQCMDVFEILPHDANSRPKTGVTADRGTDIFKSKKLDYSVVYVSVEPSIVACNSALGNWISRQPEILIDADEAILFQNMLSLYTRDTHGKPKRDKYFEHMSDNFKLMMTYCKRLNQGKENDKDLRNINERWKGKSVLELKEESLPDYVRETYGEYNA